MTQYTPAEALRRECTAAQDRGKSFPDIWQHVLKGHPLVASGVVQRYENGMPFLEVRLVAGSRLVFRDDAYSIE